MHFEEVTAAQGGLERMGLGGNGGVGAGRPVGILRNNSHLRSSVRKREWGAFRNGQGGQGGIVARSIVKGKFSRFL